MAIKISGSTIVDDSRNIVNAGIVTATSFVGDVTGDLTGNVTGNVTGNLTGNADSSSTIPQNSKSSSYTLIASDAGKHISITTGGVTIPASVFSVGDVVTIYNNSGSNQTITQGASTTLRMAGTSNTGNRTLGQFGLATLLCVASDTFVVSGVGLG